MNTPRTFQLIHLAVFVVCIGQFLPQPQAAQALSPAPVPSAGSGQAEAAGPVADLQRRIDRDEVQLKYDVHYGYLPAVLERLDVPPSSQLLVFSKTSCQRDRISPQTPRSIYFNELVYVAWIPDSPLLEISCVDPKGGAVFYTLDQKESPRPHLTRRDQCLECHTSNQTLGVPGYLVRSYATDANGTVDITDGCSMVDQSTPLGQRWGGWYVRGAGSLPNRGNALGFVTGGGPRTAPGQVQLGNYLTNSSDVVALMILEHQAQMQNLITRLRYESARTSGSGEPPERENTLDTFIRYLLFANEAPIAKPVPCDSAFAVWFQSQGPRDKQARSLRQLDLEQRLFKFPCSYMIYSEAFDSLPRALKLRIYHRLWRILNGTDPDPAFASLPGASRHAILEILTETKTDVPVEWRL